MHTRQTSESLSSWDNFRVFLEITKAGSFSSAAKRLHSTQPTISRRIQSLEQRLGVRLFDRVPSGVVLTAGGEKVLETVRYVEESLTKTEKRVLGADQRLKGSVRISLTDGLANFLLMPRLSHFQEEYPNISLEFRCSTEPVDVLSMESDLSIQYRKPESPDLVAVKLGTLHAVPWASLHYLKRFGTPSTPKELCDHRLMDHEVYHLHRRNYDTWLALLDAARQPRHWTNSSVALLNAAQNGAGVTLLPTFLCSFAEGIVPLALGLRTRCGIWLTYHPDIRRTARIRAVIEWIKGLFDQESWPWFRDEFNPPKLSTTERSST
ncbi:MAG: LysR family transcriptional regulator [Kiloniellales bacterium]|nr:LysR family transcriptional regulator [Kiloniellales bacterium]